MGDGVDDDVMKWMTQCSTRRKEKPQFLTFCVFILLWYMYMLVGQALYQDKCPSSGNNWVQYHFVMWQSCKENGGDRNTIWQIL